MQPEALRALLLELVGAAPGPIPTHELLDAIHNQVPALDEATVLEEAVKLVDEGHLLVRSDHGTVFFAAPSPPHR